MMIVSDHFSIQLSVVFHVKLFFGLQCDSQVIFLVEFVTPYRFLFSDLYLYFGFSHSL